MDAREWLLSFVSRDLVIRCHAIDPRRRIGDVFCDDPTDLLVLIRRSVQPQLRQERLVHGRYKIDFSSAQSL
eukprot:10328874-Lingulodinium_polyedra.AAC.1